MDESFNELIVEHFGYWDYDKGLDDRRGTTILSRRRRDLQGRLFKSSMVLLNKNSINDLENYR